VWNAASLFTGWADVELSTLGKNEAASAATELWKNGFQIDVAYSSRLKRAMQTLDIVLKISGQEDVPCNRCWRLNERMYGGLTGLNKVETAEKYGDEQVKIWRRSFDTPPPPVDLDSEYWPGNADEYLHVDPDSLPLAESLKDCIERTLPYWDSDITPALKRGKTVLIAAHGNSIRGMLKYLDGISDDEILSVEVPTGIPMVYHLDSDLKPIRSERCTGKLNGYFLKEATEANDPQKAFAISGIEGDTVASE
jgi:2,3-bisphosphoglycerate-dependent phosphoglycerate mutase